MKIGRVVAFLTTAGVSVGAVVALNGRESLVAKVAGSGKLVRLVKGQAFKLDTCSSGGEAAGLVREATGVSVGQSSLDLTNEIVYNSDDTVFSYPQVVPELDEDPVTKVPTNRLGSLAGFKRLFGAQAVADATKQIRHKKAFTALPKEYKAQFKKFI